jgi:dihydroxyacetone kinase-like protein
VLTQAALAQGLAGMQARCAEIRDALNAADRQLGDGDTGMTVAAIVTACHAAAAQLPVDIGSALVQLGREASRASGSSLAAVLAMGLSAAGRCARGKVSAGREDVLGMLQAAARVIMERSGASPGDKTVLDSLLRIEQDIEAAAPGAGLLRTALAGASAALDDFRTRASRLGRARMYGARSAGLDDPGMKAVVLLLAAAGNDREITR